MFLPLVNSVQACIAAVSIGDLILVGLQRRTSSWEKWSLELAWFLSLLDACGFKVKNKRCSRSWSALCSFHCLSSFPVFNPFLQVLGEPFLISLELPEQTARHGASTYQLVLVSPFAYSGHDSVLAFAALAFLRLLTTVSSLALSKGTALEEVQWSNQLSKSLFVARNVQLLWLHGLAAGSPFIL